jgi:hypothetical protein
MALGVESRPLGKGKKMKIALSVKSSSMPGIAYEVVFKNINGIITIKCNCRAGELTKLCKHKLALIRGDSSILMDDNEDYNFLNVKEWIIDSDFSQLIIAHDLAEKALAEKQQALKKIKDRLEVAMRKGI